MREKRSRNSGRMGVYIGIWEQGSSWEVVIEFEGMGCLGAMWGSGWDLELGESQF